MLPVVWNTQKVGGHVVLLLLGYCKKNATVNSNTVLGLNTVHLYCLRKQRHVEDSVFQSLQSWKKYFIVCDPIVRNATPKKNGWKNGKEIYSCAE